MNSYFERNISNILIFGAIIFGLSLGFAIGSRPETTAIVSYDFAKEWQGTIGSFVALIAAWAAFRSTALQVFLAEKLEGQRRERELFAAKSELVLILAQILRDTKILIRNINKAYSDRSIENFKILRAGFDIQETWIDSIKNGVKHSDPPYRDALRALIENIQILSARMQGSRFRGSDRILNHRIESHLYGAIEIYTIASWLIKNSRQETNLGYKISRSDIRSSMNSNLIFEENYEFIAAKIERIHD